MQSFDSNLEGVFLHCMLYVNGSMVVLGGASRTAFGEIYARSEVWISAVWPHDNYTVLSSTTPWGPRYAMACAVDAERNRMVLTGGIVGGPFPGNGNNEVWQSPDGGLTWSSASMNAPWAARSGHGLVYFPSQQALFLFGGQSTPSSVALNDVWRSVDGGSSWTQIVSHDPNPESRWKPRCHFGYAFWNGMIWLSNGFDGEGAPSPSNAILTTYSDVWRSGDGISWTQSSVSGAPSARAGAPMVGVEGWGLLIVSGAISMQTHGRLFVESNREIGDYHFSKDGVNWCVPLSYDGAVELVTRPGLYAGFQGAALASNGSAVFMSGGFSSDTASMNAKVRVFAAPLQCRSGAYRWSKLTNSPPWSPRCGQTVSEMRGKLYAYGGSVNCTAAGVQSDVFVSQDSGLTWSYSSRLSRDLPARYYHRAVYVSSTDRLYFLGGLGSTGAGSRAIYSTDGVSVVMTSANALPAAVTSVFGVATDGARIYLIGGLPGLPTIERRAGVVYRASSPFTNWTLLASVPGTGSSFPYHVHSLLWQDRLWWIGGQVGSVLSPGWVPDIRSLRTETVGPSQWVTISVRGPTAQLDARADYCLAALDNSTMFVTGGRNGERSSMATSMITHNGSVWSRTDSIPVQGHAPVYQAAVQLSGLYGMSCFTLPGEAGSANRTLVVLGGVAGRPGSPGAYMSPDAYAYSPNHCLSWPCQNGGTCISNLQRYICVCAANFSGALCQNG
jgi:hypothetical protein